MKNNINELKEKIIGSAKEEAATVLSRAGKAKERILNQAKEEEKKIKEEAEERGKILFEKEKSRIISKEKMDKKKELLVLRKQLFDLLFADLEKELSSMLKKGKLDSWIVSCCKEILKKEEEISFVAEEEYINYFEEICKNMKNIKFAGESIKAGFLIIGKDNEYDFRFSVLAGNIIKQNMKMIAVKLGVNNG